MDTVNDVITVWFALLTGSFLTAPIAVALAVGTAFAFYNLGRTVAGWVL